MKKTTTILALIFGFNLILAQGFGVQLGLNSSQYSTYEYSYDFGEYGSGTDIYPNTSITGMNIGINYEKDFSDNLFLGVGLNYSMKGSKYIEDGDDIYEFNTAYLELPLYLKYKYEASDEIGLFGLIGPSLNFGISGDVTNTYDNHVETINILYVSELDKNVDDAFQLKNMDMALNIGGGIMYNNLELKLIYSLGLSNISPYEYHDSDGSSEMTIKQNVFSINLGYRFNMD